MSTIYITDPQITIDQLNQGLEEIGGSISFDCDQCDDEFAFAQIADNRGNCTLVNYDVETREICGIETNDDHDITFLYTIAKSLDVRLIGEHDVSYGVERLIDYFSS